MQVEAFSVYSAKHVCVLGFTSVLGVTEVCCSGIKHRILHTRRELLWQGKGIAVEWWKEGRRQRRMLLPISLAQHRSVLFLKRAFGSQRTNREKSFVSSCFNGGGYFMPVHKPTTMMECGLWAAIWFIASVSGNVTMRAKTRVAKNWCVCIKHSQHLLQYSPFSKR